MENYFSIKLPEYKKAKVEIWKYINPNDLETLLGCFEIDDYKEFLTRLEKSNIKIKPDDYKRKLDQYALFSRLLAKQMNLNLTNKKDLIQIDQFYYLIKYALSNGFGKEQISALISVAKRTHEIAVETAFGNLDQSFDYFKNLLLCYAVHRPPFSINLFSPVQVENIVNYFLDSYFKQFKFYKYVYSPAVLLDLKLKYTNQPEVLNLDLNEPQANELNLDLDEARVESRVTNQLSAVSEQRQQQVQSDNKELKEFIKAYLNQHLDKMKEDLLNDDFFKSTDLLSPKGKPAQRPKSRTSSGNKTPKKK